MNKKNMKYAGIIVGVAATVMMAGGGYLFMERYKEFQFEKHLSDTAVTVNETDITLQEASYYIMEVEMAGNEQALVYDSENPNAYWNLYLNNHGEDRKAFYKDEAKEVAKENCIMAEVYSDLAIAEGMALTEAEKEECLDDAATTYEGMDGKQQSVTGLTQELLEGIMEKSALANKYVSYVAQAEGVTQANYEAEYGIESAFFQGKRTQADVKVNEELWDKISLGKITIN